MARTASPPRAVIAVLGAAQFLLVLDIGIVNVALGAVRDDVALSAATAHWVVTGYAAAFGGSLLAAARLADVVGRRRAFRAGLALFTLASLAAGSAPDAATLVAARVAQGVGAAVVSPAALALLVASVPDGRSRTRALGIWGSIGALASASGMLLGGLLVDLASWRAVFLVNVPIAAVALVAAGGILPADGARGEARVAPVSAVLATVAVGSVVLGISEDGRVGWTAPSAIAASLLGVLCLAGLVLRESRAADPLVPLHLLRVPARRLALAAGFAHGGMMLGLYFLLPLLCTQVLGYSPLQTGLALVVIRAVSTASSRVGAAAIARLGAARVLAMGFAGTAVACALLVRCGTASGYVPDLAPALVLLGVATPLAFVSESVLALDGAAETDTAIASGLLSTAQWVGGAVGVATVAATTSDSAPQRGFVLTGAIALGAAVAAVAWERAGRTVASGTGSATGAGRPPRETAPGRPADALSGARR